MSDVMSNEELNKNVQYLLDRTVILDCVSQHARAHDRHDVEMLIVSYHEDGVDEHGFAINPGPEYVGWANEAHATGSLLHTLNITTHNCDINKNEAYCESYVMVALLNNDDETARIISGRYIDRLEKRNREWKIALRRTTVDVLLSGDASILKAPMFHDQGYNKGMRDKADISYQRPLSLDETPERW